VRDAVFIHGTCAYGLAFSHRYFDVTPKKITFELKNLPPGTYTTELWQEKYGTQDESVTLAAKGRKSISFTFQGRSQLRERTTRAAARLQFTSEVD